MNKAILTLCAVTLTLSLGLAFSSCKGDTSSQNDPASCNHNFIDVYGVAPTCTENGKSDGSECSECGLVLLPQKTLNALGHSYKDGVCEICFSQQTASEGLEYSSYGNGTCCVLSLGTCTDEKVIIPNLSPDGDEVISIAKNAFRDTNISSISLPDTLSEIGESAFWGCNINTIAFPKKLKKIKSYAFCLSKLKEASFNESLEYIGESAFANTLIESISLPSSVSFLGSRAFYNCVKLKNINLKCNVTSLSVATFAQNYALESIVLPDTISSLSYREFEDCTSLTSVTLGAKLTSVEENTFSGCSALKTIYFNGTRSGWSLVSKPEGWDSSLIGYEIIYIGE